MKNLKAMTAAVLLGLSLNNYGQNCIQPTQSPSGTITVSGSAQTLVGNNIPSGTYSTESFTVAGRYAISSSISTYFTLTDNANVPIIAGLNTLTITIPAAGLYRIHVSDNIACGASGANRIVAIDPIGAALNFDGVNDYVNTGASVNSALSTLNKITVEAWVYPTSASTATFQTIVSNYSTPANEMQFMLRNAGTKYQFYIGNGSSAAYTNVNSAVGTVTLNTWQHVAGTWDGAVARIYVNGVLSGTISITYPAFNNTTNQVWIGGELAGGGEYFQGSIDEVRIWNRALCVGELLNNKNGEIPTNASGLLANYHFNQGFASETNTTVITLTDASSSAITGTLTNFALTTGSTSNWILPGGVVSGNTVTPYVTPTIAVNSGSICSGSSFTINPSGATTYTLQGGSSVVSPSTTTSYSVIGTTSLGCLTSTAFSSVNVNATPTISVNSGSICVGNSFTITPGGASTYTIQGGSAVVSPTSAASYTVAGTSTAGCVSAATVTSNITVNSLPTVSATTSSSVICSLPIQQTATLTATGATTYSWSSAASGPSTAVSPSVTTTYTVTGTNANGCKNTAVITQSVSTCTGVEAISNSGAGIMVYPNPNNGVFTLSVSDVGPNGTAFIKNVLGQVVLSESVSQEKNIIDAGSLKNGVYFIEVYMGTTKQTIKFIKE